MPLPDSKRESLRAAARGLGSRAATQAATGAVGNLASATPGLLGALGSRAGGLLASPALGPAAILLSIFGPTIFDAAIAPLWGGGSANRATKLEKEKLLRGERADLIRLLAAIQSEEADRRSAMMSSRSQAQMAERVLNSQQAAHQQNYTLGLLSQGVIPGAASGNTVRDIRHLVQDGATNPMEMLYG